MRYIACEVVPAIRAAIKEHGDLSDMEDLAIMIGYAGHLFVLDENLSISDIDEYEAIGVGAKYALGYMYAKAAEAEYPEYAISDALECASHFCFGCSGPFVIDSI
jgi:ATP-dependent protease HslVU (ClpYQ) peptidase subunit